MVFPNQGGSEEVVREAYSHTYKLSTYHSLRGTTPTSGDTPVKCKAKNAGEEELANAALAMVVRALVA